MYDRFVAAARAFCRARPAAVLALMLAAALAAGCAQTGRQADGEANDHGTHQLPNGDLQERTASARQLPAFLSGQRQEIADVYKVAAEHAELLEWIPCYCGCGESTGHKSNINCFIHEIAEDGSVVWDDHGTRCGICLEIALQSALLQKEGKSVKEIRDRIDATYEGKAGSPTPTPMPQ